MPAELHLIYEMILAERRAEDARRARRAPVQAPAAILAALKRPLSGPVVRLVDRTRREDKAA